MDIYLRGVLAFANACERVIVNGISSPNIRARINTSLSNPECSGHGCVQVWERGQSMCVCLHACVYIYMSMYGCVCLCVPCMCECDREGL